MLGTYSAVWGVCVGWVYVFCRRYYCCRPVLQSLQWASRGAGCDDTVGRVRRDDANRRRGCRRGLPDLAVLELAVVRGFLRGTAQGQPGSWPSHHRRLEGLFG